MHWSEAVMEIIPTEVSEHHDLAAFLVGKGNKAKKFFLHKTWLKLSSASFRNLLLQNEKSYNLPNLKPDTFEEILKHIYTFSEWEFNGNLVDACCLLKSGLDNDLEELTHSIISKLSEIPLEEVGLTIDIACFVFDVLRNTSSLDEGKLKDVILSYICKNAKLVLILDSFLKLSLNGLLEVLGDDNLEVNSELDVFKAVVRWGMNSLSQNGKCVSPENLEEALKQPFEVVRFSCMSNFEYEYYVQRMGFTTPRETITSSDNEVDGESSFEMPPLGISSGQLPDSMEALARNRRACSNSERVQNGTDNLKPTMEDMLRAELYVSNFKFQMETSLMKSMLSQFKDETRRVLLTSIESLRNQVKKLEPEIAALRKSPKEMYDEFKSLKKRIAKLEEAQTCHPINGKTQFLQKLPVQSDRERFMEIVKSKKMDTEKCWFRVQN